MSSVACPSCSGDNVAGSRFCNHCGAALDVGCPSCGIVNPPGSRFCNSCGTQMTAQSASPSRSGSPVAPSATTGPATPSRAQRRLVSVLFSDLEGFTSFSEQRDPEEVRSFLTAYFDRSREIIERFAGTIEKFIGDAVMAVWGTVEARENDAERAVRAGLELVDLIETLGKENGIPDLRIRVGVLTGEAAVGPGGNESTGMIVGDLVNSASRLQASAPAGSVLVGDVTERLTNSSIQFEPFGTLAMKGKAEPIEAFKALRVIAQRQGRRAAEGLEPPFVGREDEFRLLKDQLHATGRDRGARLVSVVGDPGIGKTRITWELEKYADGISDTIFWHHGRSPDYGEGLTFWALAEMIRQRTGIAEVDEPSKARMKLRTALAEYAPAEEDQRWIEPWLAGLLGLDEMPPGERGEMFSAVRALLQRIAERGTTVLVFEDLHWADDGTIAFISELVERSSRSPILVVTLGRPDLLDRYPGWGSGRRNTMSMQLAPLSEASMRDLVRGTLPGIDDGAVEKIIALAGGVPLYAVEFIRMLISTGEVVRRDDGGFALVGDIGGLSVPETVQAVIGSRLDRLGPDDHSLIEDASVLGQSFTLEGLAGMRDQTPDELRSRLMTLVRDELLEFEEDPRSPERGQYRFIQGLIREVAYGRLGREDRADRHLRAARHFEALGDIELAAALATHYVAAYEASGENPELQIQARNALIDAARRASELHAHRQTISLLSRALEISSDEHAGASILEQMSEVATVAGDNETAVHHALEAIERHRRAGDMTGVRRAATLAGRAYTSAARLAAAQDLLGSLYDPDAADVDAVTLALELELARAHMHGDGARSLEIAERALARDHGVLPMPTLVDGIINRGNALAGVGRFIEGRALMSGVVDIADGLGLGRQALRALWNLSVFYQFDNLKLSHTMMAEVFERAQRIGDGQWSQMACDARALGAIQEGRFSEAVAILDEFDEPDLPEAIRRQFEFTRLNAALYQDATPELVQKSHELIELVNPDEDVRANTNMAHAEVDFVSGDFAAAIEHEIVYAESAAVPSPRFFAAIWLGDRAEIARGIDDVRGGSPGRYADSIAMLLEASLTALDGGNAGPLFRQAIDAMAQYAPALEVAIACALFARRVGFANPEAADAGERARMWFESVGADQLLITLADALPAGRVAATGT